MNYLKLFLICFSIVWSLSSIITQLMTGIITPQVYFDAFELAKGIIDLYKLLNEVNKNRLE